MLKTVVGQTVIGAKPVDHQMADGTLTVGNQVWANNRTAYARQDWKITEIIQVPYLSGIVGS